MIPPLSQAIRQRPDVACLRDRWVRRLSGHAGDPQQRRGLSAPPLCERAVILYVAIFERFFNASDGNGALFIPTSLAADGGASLPDSLPVFSPIKMVVQYRRIDPTQNELRSSGPGA